MVDNPAYKQWITKAQSDEHSLTVLLKHQGSPDTITFLTQQVAEKYLKGFLAYNRQPIPKIHQIERLLKLCEKIEPDFNRLEDAGILLSQFYIESRYPGNYPPLPSKMSNKPILPSLTSNSSFSINCHPLFNDLIKAAKKYDI